jgi:putative ABC transport system permease protein
MGRLVHDMQSDRTASNRLWFWLRLIADSIRHAAGLHAEARAARRASPKLGDGAIMIQDVRYAVRRFRQKPIFTAIAVFTLALGIGGTTAMFSVVDGVVLRPLPYRDSDQLVTVWETYPYWRGLEILNRSWDRIRLAIPDYDTWAEHQTVFSNTAIYRAISGVLVGEGEPERLDIGHTSASLFPLLGVEAAVGRLPSTDDLSGPPVLLLSHSFWTKRFGRDPGVVGQSLVIERPAGDTMYTIVGVLPQDFRFRLGDLGPNDNVAVWTLIDPRTDNLIPDHHTFEAIARLKPGVSLEQAGTETDILLRGRRDPSVRGARLVSRLEEETGAVRLSLALLVVAVGFVLLIACGNVANLLLGDVAGRKHEIALRSAIGAGRMRIMRQFLTESLLLALAGAAVGTLLAYWGTRFLVLEAPSVVPRVTEISVDLRALGFAILVAVTTGILFGLAPAILSSRLIPNAVIRGGSHRSASRRRAGIQRCIAVGEVALSLILLVGAGLLGETLVRLSKVDPGFEVDELLRIELSLPPGRYGPSMAKSFYRELSDRLKALPGVVAVTASDVPPFSGNNSSNSIEVEGMVTEGKVGPEAQRRYVFPNYFQTLGVPILRGRTLTPSDLGADVIVVNETMAQRFWPDSDPIGKRIEFNGRWHMIVGVVADTKNNSLAQQTETTFFLANDSVRDMHLLIRTGSNALALVPAVRRELAEMDARIPLLNVSTMEGMIASTLDTERYRAFLTGAFALIAVVLVAVGLYGVISMAVTRRTRELGIRMALGAQRSGILSMILADGIVTTAAGITLGVFGSLFLTHYLESLLFGVPAVDAPTYGAAVLAVSAITLTACYVPALQATRVDPTEALRTE